MKNQQGFTLIELMIVVAIIAILAAIAIPQYQDYVSRSRAAGAVAEMSGYRTAVSACMSELQTKTGCSAGSNGVPAVGAVTKNIVSVPTITDGVITVTKTGATDSAGANLSLILTPASTATGMMTWTNGGTICNATRGLKPGQGDCP